MTQISYQTKIKWLQLARSENVGRSTFFRLLEIFGSIENALDKIDEFALSGGLRRKIKICSKEEAEKEFEETEKFGAKIFLFCQEEYPYLLKQISDPSPLITVKGRTELFNEDTIAIVGPRNASFNAINFAKNIAADLGKNSIIIVSGMARGVDCAAHSATINSGTIAVIAGGINHIYPQENAKLYNQISNQGLLVCENPFNFLPKGGNFVQRNRIISALSYGVLVIEASLKSGSLITAKFAIEQGREVFAIPGSPLDYRCLGTNRLIKEGAKLTENLEDILEEFPSLRVRFSRKLSLKELEEERISGNSVKFPSDNEINKIREEIFSKLNFSPISIEQVIYELQVPARFVNIAIVQLELADKVTVSSGMILLKNNQ
jgi:DNA processing protein